MRKKRVKRDGKERKGEQKRKDRNTEKRKRRAVWKNERERISVILEEQMLRPVELLKLFKPQLIGNASRGLHPHSHTVTVPL